MAVVLGSGWSPGRRRARAPPQAGDPARRPRAASRRPRWPATPAVVRSLTVGGLRVLVFLGRVHLYEGTPAAGRGARRADRGRGGLPGGRAHQRGRRDQRGLPGRPAGADQRPPEPDRPVPAVRPAAAGRIPAAVRRPHRPVLGPAAGAGPREADPSLAEGVYAALPGPHYETPAEIRMLAYPRRRPGRHVHRPGGDRRPPPRRRGAGDLAGHQPRRRPGRRQGSTTPRWSRPGRRPRAGWAPCWPRSLPRCIVPCRRRPADLPGRSAGPGRGAWIADDPRSRRTGPRRDLRPGRWRTPAATAAGGRSLADRFAGRLEFGTAGLRGAMAAGPNRMNRAVVRAATAALARWLQPSTAAGRGRRRGGHRLRRPAPVGGFADEAAPVLAGAGIARAPAAAAAARRRCSRSRSGTCRAAAGIMITASHNPPADNGYKLYLGDGAQIVPPVDAEIEAAIRGLGPAVADPGSRPLDSPLITRHGDEVARGLPGRGRLGPAGRARRRPGCGSSTRRCTGSRPGWRCGRSSGPGSRPPHVVAAQAEPDPDFPTVAFPNPEEPGALDLALAEARRPAPTWCWPTTRTATGWPWRCPTRHAAGGWRTLTGDQVGALLGALPADRDRRPSPTGDRLVPPRSCRPRCCPSIAAAAGAQYAETLTGFKWIVRARRARPAAGSCSATRRRSATRSAPLVRDKDGIGAALALLGLARPRPGGRGESLLDALGRARDRARRAPDRAAHAAHRGAGRGHGRAAGRRPAALAGSAVLSERTDLAGGDPAPADVLTSGCPAPGS